MVTSLRRFRSAVLGVSVLALSAQGVHAEKTPVPVQGGKVAVSPETASVRFVCAHRGPKPDPRKGTFTAFSGEAVVDAQAKALKGLTVEFDTTSLSTEFANLTTHLKSPDFFDVREHKKASFVVDKVTPGAKPGEFQVTGKLTLLGKTKEVKAPVHADFSDKGVTLVSEFAIDRSEFGMNYGPDKIENTVQLRFCVGEKNPTLAEAKK